MKQNIFKIGCIALCLSWSQMAYAQDSKPKMPYPLDAKAQMKAKAHNKNNATQVYKNTFFHEPVKIDVSKLKQDNEVKNIILIIGDGMGVAQMYSGMTANHGKLNLEYLKYIGFSSTQPFDEYITDSAASGTAIATGVKTYNGAIGVNPDTAKIQTIIELAEENGLSTGIVTTCDITDATPASFIAHQKSRDMHDAIALDYLKTDVDLVIGGGLRHFADRRDGQLLLPLLENKGYTVITDAAELGINKGSNIFALIDAGDLPRAKHRKNYLTQATKTALNRLEKNDKGFFLMIEGSQIDWGGHENNTSFIVDEVLDLDRAIGTALEFATKKGETLILCTADHETGGMTLEAGNIATGEVRADYTSDDHTGVIVPVYSIGPGAEEFMGFYENTALFDKMTSLLKLK